MTPLFFAALLILVGIVGPAAAQTRMVASFETEADLQAVKANSTRVTLTSEHATEGQHALQIEYLPAEWPNMAVAAESSWDWRGFGGLALDITNPGSEPVEFGVRVDDDPSANGVVHCRQGAGTITPGKTDTFVLPLGPNPMEYGMRGLPTVPGVHSLASQAAGPINLGHIVAFQIFLHRPPAARTLLVDNIRLIPYTVSLDGIVDAYGQYAKADWPGKLKDEAEFAKRRAEEAAELKAHPTLPDRDKYGGWASGPQLPATGFFRTEKRDGKWWLVTPEGHLFFSLGIDCVGTENATFITGREKMFTWLPEEGSPLARHRGYVRNVHSGPVKEGVTFNFLTANLERKYGQDYEKAWRETALARLQAWGFNTIGNWSDETLYRNGRIPYVATAHINGDHARLSSGSDYWGKMHDPFDPRFAVSVANSLRPVVQKVKGDPWCLGYFVDNELSWGGGGEENGRYGLAYGALAEEASSPAKQAFLAQLKAKYGDIAKLNAAWGTDFAAWDALNAAYRPAGPLSPALKADMAAFVKSLARRYFQVIHDTLKQADSDHLYLGCRFAWQTPEAVEASAEICDVVSFNIYAPRVDPARWAFLNALNKPCIIGEFHFGALDRGMFHTGLVATPNQQARAAMYMDYVRSVLDHPAFVGCHWFQYLDEPLTGRTYDGENYNIGFVNVTDTPYPEMVAAAKTVHAEAYSHRAGQSATSAAAK